MVRIELTFYLSILYKYRTVLLQTVPLEFCSYQSSIYW
nr:MAG TPA: hypothetical protein [Caudoviricetes sp.]